MRCGRYWCYVWVCYVIFLLLKNCLFLVDLCSVVVDVLCLIVCVIVLK